MRIILEVKNGPQSGQKTWLIDGEVVQVGRTADADFVVAGDHSLSSIHFALEYSNSGCRVRDRRSTNGTFVNGVRITEAILRNNDQIQAGNTIFAILFDEEAQVQAPPVAQAPTQALSGPDINQKSSVVVGHWSFSSVPVGWEPLEGFGVRRITNTGSIANVVITEDQIPEGKSLHQYVESQLPLLREAFPNIVVNAPEPTTISAAEEAIRLSTRHTNRKGQCLTQHQIYARSAHSFGVITFTTDSEDSVTSQSLFTEILDSVRTHY